MSKFKELCMIMEEAVKLVNRNGYHVNVYSTLNTEEKEKFDNYVLQEIVNQKNTPHIYKGNKCMWLDLCFQGLYNKKDVVVTRLHFIKDGNIFTGHYSEYPYSSFTCKLDEFSVVNDDMFGYLYFHSILTKI